MSDLSEIEQLVKAGAMSANGECRIDGTSRLVVSHQKIQLVPVLDSKIGIAAIRDHFQTHACHGNARAAKLLQRLVFRYLPEENGKARLKTYRYKSFWWEKSYEDWATELGLTKKQVATDFAKLADWGIAEARPLKVYEGKNAGKTVIHARVLAADGAASLNGWPDYELMRTILGFPNGIPYGTPKWDSHSNYQMGIHKTKEEVKSKKQKLNIKEPVAQKTGNGTASINPTTTGTASGKATPKANPAVCLPSEEISGCWIALKNAWAVMNDKPDWQVTEVPELEVSPLQRFEHALTQTDIDPPAFFEWLTLRAWQHFNWFVSDTDCVPNALYLHAHRAEIFTTYEFEKDEQDAKDALKAQQAAQKAAYWQDVALAAQTPQQPQPELVPMTDEEKNAAKIKSLSVIEVKLKPTTAAPPVLPTGWSMQPDQEVTHSTGGADLTTASPADDDDHHMFRPAPTKAEEDAEIVRNNKWWTQAIKEKAEAEAAQALKKSKSLAPNMKFNKAKAETV